MRHSWLGLPIVICSAGLVLWWTHGGTSDRNSELGAALISGALISVAVLFIERRQTREAERRNTQLALGAQATLDHVDLSNYDLTQSHFLRSKSLKETNFQGAKLVRANLSKAILDSANFKGADLRNADFAGCSLRGARFYKADLRGVNFAGAELERADLHEADLRGTNFNRTSRAVAAEVALDLAISTSRFVGTLLGAVGSREGGDDSSTSEHLESLREPAKHLKTAKLDEAWYSSATKWPPGVNPEELGAVQVGGPINAFYLSLAHGASRIAQKVFRGLLFVLLRRASSPSDLQQLVVKSSGSTSMLGGILWLFLLVLLSVNWLVGPKLQFIHTTGISGLLIEVVTLLTVSLSMVGLVAFYAQRKGRYGDLGRRGFTVCLVGALLYTFAAVVLRLSIIIYSQFEPDVGALVDKRHYFGAFANTVMDVGLLLVGIAAVNRRKQFEQVLERWIGGLLVLAATSDILQNLFAVWLTLSPSSFYAGSLLWRAANISILLGFGFYGALWLVIGYLLRTGRPIAGNASDEPPDQAHAVAN